MSEYSRIISDDPPRNQFITVAQAAEAAVVHPQMVRRWIGTGALRSVTLGPRTTRILRSDLETFLMEKRSVKLLDASDKCPSLSIK